MQIAPCKDCKLRHFKCHTECKLYSDWRKDLEESKKQISQQVILSHQLKERKLEAINRMQPFRKRNKT